MRPTVFCWEVFGLSKPGCLNRSIFETAAAVCLALICLAGCSKKPPLDNFGQLPGLVETPHQKLRDELARIVEEEGTPQLLTRAAIPDEQNVAAGLVGLFEDSFTELILEESGKILPSGEFKFDPARLERAARFRAKYEEQRIKARGALARPKCDFRIEFERGYEADLPFVEAVWICARLEEFQAAELLAADDLAGAIQSAVYVLRLAECLAEEKHVHTRGEAAYIRAEAFNVLRRIVRYPEIDRPKITPEQLQQLHAVIKRQLDAWPPDARAWIGDRALGMYAYELVRVGGLIVLLTDEEIEAFKEEGILNAMPAAARRNVNDDEFYYLQAMRKVIQGCGRPYFERLQIFESIRNDLQQKRNSTEFPLVAGRLLLPDIEKVHLVQAQDRTNCETWALALAIAAGVEPPSYELKPVTGKKYEILRRGGLVSVWEGGQLTEGTGPPVVVPDLSQSQ